MTFKVPVLALKVSLTHAHAGGNDANTSCTTGAGGTLATANEGGPTS